MQIQKELNDKKSIEMLKEFYSKHQSAIDALAAADEKMFRAVKDICCSEKNDAVQPANMVPTSIKMSQG